MVFLARLLCQRPKGADFGLYAGVNIMSGVKVTFSNKKTKRKWYPNVQRKTYYSDILGVKFQLRVTTKAMRCIDKAGGFDGYIMNTPSHKLQSKLGEYLREEMKKEVKAKGLTPPPVIRRIQRPPKSWAESSQNSATPNS